MSKKVGIIIIFVAVVALISAFVAFLIWPEKEEGFSCGKARLAAKEYLAQQYPDYDYQISNVSYDGHYQCYVVNVYLPESKDNKFILEYDTEGQLVNDTYQNFVAYKTNTAIRLPWEYTEAVEKVLTSVPNHSGFTRTAQLLWTYPGGASSDPRYIASEKLELDKDYDLSELGAQAGYVWFRVKVASKPLVTAETLAPILLYVRKTLDEADLPFYQISCQVDYYSEDETQSLELENFLYEDIYEEGLEARLRQALIS